MEPASSKSDEMAKKAFQVDAKVSVRCAVLAIDQNDAKERMEAELYRLLTCAPPLDLYLDIVAIEISVPDIKDAQAQAPQRRATTKHYAAS